MMNSKFTSRFASLAVAALSGLLLMTACEKEKEDTVNIPEGALRISAESTHSSNGSKTTVDGTAVYWTDGDVINVNGTEGTVLFSEGAAYLSGINNSVDMYAGFPANIISVSGSNITVNIPSSYNYDEREGRQKVDLPMVAYAEANSDRLDFKHVCAAIQVNVTNAFNGAEFYLEKITVSSNSHPLCGSVTVSPNPLGVTHIPSYSASTASVTMNFGDEEVSVGGGGSKSIQIPVLLTLGSSTISVDIEGHYANGADFGSGRVDAAAKIVYHNSSSTLLERAKVYPAPCTIRVSGSAAVTKIYPKFSVSSTQKVYFSKGNLQYIASSNTWQFASTQTEVIGNANSNISASYSSPIDLFGWGTGTNPTNTSTDNANYSTFNDWGTRTLYGSTTWRTLSYNEWAYLLGTRDGNRFAKAIINSKYGVILFPDNYSPSITISNINNEGANFVNISTSNWTKLESDGCIFLPTSGFRNGTTITNVASAGYYWTSTSSNATYSRRIMFNNSSFYSSNYAGNKHNGMAVRLVQDAN